MTEIRQLDASFLEERLALVSYAFQWELSPTNIERFTDMSAHSWNYGSFDEEGKLASQIMATPFHVDFHGTDYQMAGIGFVASYPEYRSQGRIDGIMREILQQCREQGIELSYLAPFSYPFYRRYGYELVFERAVYESAANRWPDSPKVSGRLERISWEKAKPIIQKIYQNSPRNYLGGLIREDWWWEYKFGSQEKMIYTLYRDTDQRVQGYLVYTIESGNMQIVEWDYLSNEAFHGLNRFVASHGDSLNNIRYDVGYGGDSFQFLLDVPFNSIRIRPEMMARVVDVGRFLVKYPFEKPLSEAFAISIQEDKYASWNTGTYELLPCEANVAIKRVEQTDLPCLTMSIQRFTQLFMGYQSLEQLVLHELVVGDEKASGLLRDLLPPQKPILEDYF